MLTTPTYNLNHNAFILHVRSPNVNNTHLETGESINELNYYNLFKQSFIELNTSSICTPLIGTGGMKISLSDSVNDLLVALEKFLKENSMLDQSDTKIVYIINNEERILDQVVQIIDIKLNPSTSNTNEVTTNHWSEFVNPNIGTKSVTWASDTNPFPVTAPNLPNPLSVSEVSFQLQEHVSTLKLDEIDPTDLEECFLCKNTIKNPKKLDKCEHKFCKHCIDDHFKNVMKNCPVCNKVYGVR